MLGLRRAAFAGLGIAALIAVTSAVIVEPLRWVPPTETAAQGTSSFLSVVESLPDACRWSRVEPRADRRHVIAMLPARCEELGIAVSPNSASAMVWAARAGSRSTPHFLSEDFPAQWILGVDVEAGRTHRLHVDDEVKDIGYDTTGAPATLEVHSLPRGTVPGLLAKVWRPARQFDVVRTRWTEWRWKPVDDAEPLASWSPLSPDTTHVFEEFDRSVMRELNVVKPSASWIRVGEAPEVFLRKRTPSNGYQVEGEWPLVVRTSKGGLAIADGSAMPGSLRITSRADELLVAGAMNARLYTRYGAVVATIDGAVAFWPEQTE